MSLSATASSGQIAALLAAEGETGGLIAAHDWSATALGAIEAWPQSLMTAVTLMIHSPVPMVMLWGVEGVMLYNDAYSGFAGGRHPQLMGAKVREGWPEVADFNDHVMQVVLAGGTLAYRDQELVLSRNGVPEPVWMNLDYSPVHDESGTPAGVIAIVVETTERVLAERSSAGEREQLARMFEQAPTFMAMLSGPEQRFELANPGFVRLIGNRDVIGRTLAEALPDAVEQGFLALLDKVYRSGKAFTATGAVLHARPRPGGPSFERHVDFVCQPILDAAGNVSGIFIDGADVTRRELADAARRESEEDYRYAVELSPRVSWTATAAGQLDRIADRWREWTGRSGLTDGWGDAIHPDDRPRAIDDWARAVASGEPYEGEARVLMADGGYRWMRISAFARRDDRGGIVKWYGSTEDIHERKLTEQRLRDSEARFRGVTEAMPGFVWTARADGRLNYVSGRWADYAGSEDHALGTLWLDFIHPDDHAAASAAWAESVAGGTLYEIEFRLRRHDHVYRWWLARAVPMRDEQGRVLRWIGSAADINEIVAAREVLARSQTQLEAEVARRSDELRESDARLRAVFATSHLYQSLLSVDGALVDANAASLEGIGASLDEVVGMPFWQAPWFTGTPGMSELVRDMVGRVAGGASETRAVTLDLPVGRRSFDLSMRPVRGADGAIVGIVPEAVETTARLQAEEALRQSQKMEAMGQLTGGVAHDFNNLLTPIIGSLDMLQRRGIGNDREKRLIDGALQAGERAKTLVQRLLAFARRQPLRPEPVDVGALVTGMCDLIARTSGPRIKLTVDAPDTLPPARADANQLEMALLNLSVNARDAMPDGGELTIAVVTDRVAGRRGAGLTPGDYLKLSVIDTGVGMDAATLARVFEPFFSTKGVGQGTGLGLSMVHGLASQLGGAVAIDSKPGLGTRVDLWLPVSEVLPAGATPSERSVPTCAPAGTALLVDDENLVRASTAEMLAELGFDVVEAESAEAALAMLDDGRRVDLLVTDHLMPGMTGTELARKVRRALPGMPVLVISGYSEVESIAPELPRLPKPFRRADLAASLAGLQALTGGAAATASRPS